MALKLYESDDILPQAQDVEYLEFSPGSRLSTRLGINHQNFV